MKRYKYIIAYRAHNGSIKTELIDGETSWKAIQNFIGNKNFAGDDTMYFDRIIAATQTYEIHDEDYD